MKYDKRTNEYGKWLFQYIDRFDWAVTERQDRYHRNCENYVIEGQLQRVQGCYAPQKMTRTHLQLLLHQKIEKLHYLSRRSSEVALITLDFDEHHQEGDSFEAAAFVQSAYLPNTYLECTPRGARLFLLVHVGFIKRNKFNSLLDALTYQLAVVLDEFGYKSTVEVLGGFTVWDSNTENLCRGHTASLPYLWNGFPDLRRLTALPVHFLHAFQPIGQDAAAFVENAAQSLDATAPSAGC